MVNIYNESNSNYNNNGDMILEPSSAILDMELNGLNLVTVEHDYDYLNRWKSIKGDRVIKVDAPNDQTMLYKINNTDKSLDDSIEFTAIPLMQDLDKSALIDCRPTNSNGQQAIDKILDGTKFKGHSNISSIFTSHLIRKSRLAALVGNDENSFISKYGGEIFTTGYDIWINDRIGNDKGVVFEYAKDIIDFNENLNWDNVLTRVYPVGFDGITLDNNAYVDSSNINKYQEIKEGFIKFDDVKVKETPEDEEGFNTLQEAQAELIKRTKELFENGLDTPTLEMDVEVEKLENTLDYKKFKNLLLVGLGDDVEVNLAHLGININTRVIAYTWDILNKKFISIKLGSYINNFIQDQADISNVIDNITNSNGTVNAVAVQGILNGINVQMKAMRDIAQNVPVRAMICEDLVPDSPTFGAMCWGTMGFMISDKRLPDNSDWDFRTFGTGKGFFADLIVAGTMLADRIRGGVLESIDGSLRLDLTDTTKGIQFKKNGLRAIAINGHNVDFYDWNGLGEGVAKIYATRFGSNALKPGLAIANRRNSAISIAYEGLDGTYSSYVTFDKYGVLGPKCINFSEDVYFWNIEVANYIKSNGLRSLDDENNILFESKDTWVSNKNFKVNGDFAVVGTKNCVQKTENYGNRLFYSVEDGQSFLTETSEGNFTVEKQIDGSFERCILINTIFKECVDLSEHYVIDINKVSWGDYKIKEQTPDGFILESDREDFIFNYCIKAKRKGYEKVSLEEFIDREVIKDVKNVNQINYS